MNSVPFIQRKTIKYGNIPTLVIFVLTFFHSSEKKDFLYTEKKNVPFLNERCVMPLTL